MQFMWNKTYFQFGCRLCDLAIAQLYCSPLSLCILFLLGTIPFQNWHNKNPLILYIFVFVFSIDFRAYKYCCISFTECIFVKLKTQEMWSILVFDLFMSFLVLSCFNYDILYPRCETNFHSIIISTNNSLISVIPVVGNSVLFKSFHLFLGNLKKYD